MATSSTRRKAAPDPDARVDFYLVEAPTLPEAASPGVLDLAPPASRDPYDVAVAALGRSAPQLMAIDAAAEAERPHPSMLSTQQLRAERDELAALFAGAPKDQRRVHRRTVEQLGAVEAQLAGVQARVGERESWLASHARGLAGLAHRDETKATRADLANLRQQQSWLEEKLAGLKQRERQRAAWDETHTSDVEGGRVVAAELAWRSKARCTARTVDAPAWLGSLLGSIPDSTRGRRAWRAAAEQAEGYRDRYHVQANGLGERPTDLGQLRAWRACHETAHHLSERGRVLNGEREQQGGRPGVGDRLSRMLMHPAGTHAQRSLPGGTRRTQGRKGRAQPGFNVGWRSVDREDGSDGQ
ncbi:MAG: hypothetical protein ACRDYA_23685 [Egibacteraceae bacterium]